MTGRLCGLVGPIPLEDLVAVAEILIATERTIPPQKWVDHLVDEAEEAAINALF